MLLLDEPCSALDPISTGKIEELIHELKTDYTVVIVTHNMQQAARCSDYTAYMYLGDLIEFGPTDRPLHEAEEEGHRGLHHRALRLSVADCRQHAMSDKHLSTQFDAELSGISTRVLEMGGLVESQVAQAVYALTTFSGETPRRCSQPRSASTRWRSRSTATCRPSSRGASRPRATCAC